MNFKKVTTVALLTLSVIMPTVAYATIVEFHTSQGNFKVNLFDQTTPKTVENFLSYVNDGDYIDTVIHRHKLNFVTQGGGFKFEGSINLSPIATKPTVVNEPVYSNVTGTIAMARLPGKPNSATSQWFINLKDNSSNLDVTDEGFTVFGQVIDGGMSVIDTISTFSLCNDIPMPEYSSQDCTSGLIPGSENFVTIHQITIVDSSVTSASDLNPVENTLIDQVNDAPQNGSSGGGGGGSASWIALSLLGLSAYFRKRNAAKK